MTTYNGLIDVNVLMRATIDRIILVEPLSCAFQFGVFQNVDIDEVIVYLSTGFPEIFNYPEIWGKGYPKEGMKKLGLGCNLFSHRHDTIKLGPVSYTHLTLPTILRV